MNKHMLCFVMIAYGHSAKWAGQYYQNWSEKQTTVKYVYKDQFPRAKYTYSRLYVSHFYRQVASLYRYDL